MSRYPYTEAYDAMRAIPGKAPDGISTSLSRSDCAQLCQYIANAIGFTPEDLACKIADHSRNIDAGDSA